ncbi:MAG: hypothetical protein K2O18_04800, partial [Oscillospiraceae bacterium]|nr:hypothetical protein [Oscillospiraceae bacterium]
MKKHTFRRFLALALSMILCFSLISVTALAQSPDETTTNDAPTIRILTPVDTPDGSSGNSYAETPPAAASEESAPSEKESEPAEAGVSPAQTEEESGKTPDKAVPNEAESDKADNSDFIDNGITEITA